MQETLRKYNRRQVSEFDKIYAPKPTENIV